MAAPLVRWHPGEDAGSAAEGPPARIPLRSRGHSRLSIGRGRRPSQRGLEHIRQLALRAWTPPRARVCDRPSVAPHQSARERCHASSRSPHHLVPSRSGGARVRATGLGRESKGDAMLQSRAVARRSASFTDPRSIEGRECPCERSGIRAGGPSAALLGVFAEDASGREERPCDPSSGHLGARPPEANPSPRSRTDPVTSARNATDPVTSASRRRCSKAAVRRRFRLGS